MGYRSEIGILITIPEETNSDELISKIKDLWGDDFYDCFSVKKFSEGKYNFLTFHSNWIKWYGTYTCVMNVENFIENWEDNYKTGGIHFIRIGEDYDDFEEKYYGTPEKYIDCVRYLEISGLETW